MITIATLCLKRDGDFLYFHEQLLLSLKIKWCMQIQKVFRSSLYIEIHDVQNMKKRRQMIYINDEIVSGLLQQCYS